MTVDSIVLINDLSERTLSVISEMSNFNQLSLEELNWKSSPESWSILECFQHLNLYGEFYIPEIRNRINTSTTSSQPKFKAGILGDYFAKSMLPKEKLNKMKTFRDKYPAGSNLDKRVIEQFLSQQNDILNLLEKASNIDLNKVKTAISISKFIKLKLGDTFRVVIYHNERHLVQANNVLTERNKD